MSLLIYNPNSKGGNFDYSIQIFNAFVNRKEFNPTILLLPSNAMNENVSGMKKILLRDTPPSSIRLLSQTYFLFRSLVNPFIVFVFLLRNRKIKYVLFNDYDQATSFLWVPFFKAMRSKVVYAAMLHDPDRDGYFSNLRISIATMQTTMSLMDLAFYHEYLPQKPYYNSNTKYISVPHGLYPDVTLAQADSKFKDKILRFKGNDHFLIAALGNIREEKNYKLIIASLLNIPHVKLLICGTPANTSIKVSEYFNLIRELKLENRVLFIEKYLEPSELKAVQECSDAFILYYSESFKSQSGMLNLLAPSRKPLLTSDNESAMSTIVKRFKLGLVAIPDSKDDLTRMIEAFCNGDFPAPDWEGYFKFASWDEFAAITSEQFKLISA
jgi:glycosyltransferase involved in cell wall biosynthesis